MIEKKLERFINNEKRVIFKSYTLEAITFLLNYYGNPHKKIQSIHIGGTNGKGSVAYFLNSIFIQSQYKTGLFTSPHLINLNERISIDNHHIPDSILNQFLDELEIVLEKNSHIEPTYFDIITLFAFRFFFESSVDIAIIEVGLGGRIDTTNVINPLCSVITEIALDHQYVLGDTLSEISREKAGIIKKGVPVATINQHETIADVLKKVASGKEAPIYFYNKEFYSSNIREVEKGHLIDYNFSLPEKYIKIKDIELNYPAPFQIQNASLAITAAKILSPSFKNIKNSSIKEGIKKTYIPGRFEILSRKPFIVFDPAHNIHALKAVSSILKQKFKGNDFIIVLSLMNDKDYTKILNLIKTEFKDILYFILPFERCFVPDQELIADYNLKVFQTESELIEKIKEKQETKAWYLFTGTFQLYGVAKNIISTIEDK